MHGIARGFGFYTTKYIWQANDLVAIRRAADREENIKQGFAKIIVNKKEYHVAVDHHGKYVVKRNRKIESPFRRTLVKLFSNDLSRNLENSLNFKQNEKEQSRLPEPLRKALNNALHGIEAGRREIPDRTMRKNMRAISTSGPAGKLNGILYQANRSSQTGDDKKTVIFLHGTRESAEQQSIWPAYTYNQNGYDVVAINMRGYGGSEGTPSEQGMYRDAEAIFKYVTQELHVAPANAIIHGYSLGGAVAANLYSTLVNQGIEPAGLILDRPMPDLASGLRVNEIPNPLGLTGTIASAAMGRFDVRKHLQGIRAPGKIMLILDNSNFRSEGRKMYENLQKDGVSMQKIEIDKGHFKTFEIMQNAISDINSMFR